MAIKQPKKPLTPNERAMTDRATRARKSYPRFDRHGGYMEACAALAEETGCDVVSAYSEWRDRVEARLYTGMVDVDDAESAAMNDVRERYRNAS